MSSTYLPNDTLSHSGMNGSGRHDSGSEGTQGGGIGAAFRQGKRDLRGDLDSLKRELDELGRAESLSEVELQDAYGQMMSRFATLRYAAKGIASQAGQQFSQGMNVTTEYVKDSPLQAVGIAAGVGLLLGMLLGGR